MFGGELLPGLLPYIENAMNVDLSKEATYQENMEIAPPIINHDFLEELGTANISRRSFMQWERVGHSHGATFKEVAILMSGKFSRCADCVIYPSKHEDVETLVKVALKHNVMLVPYGGGTNVTDALELPHEEKRMIVSVDMSRMNAIRWVDKENGMACIQAGIQGQDLERELKQYGMICGHEPDSAEFSTLGGWVATRASGMKKNTYGNMEDIVCNLSLVTTKGTFTKTSLWPRTSNGPDLTQLILGSEGNYGIVTEVTIKVKPLPEVRIFDSILFHDWETGIKFCYEVSKTKQYPTSMRLVDNEQFKFGSTMKPAITSAWENFVENAKKFFVVNIKGYNPD